MYDYQTDLEELEQLVRRHQRQGFTFANIGANDGVISDPCWPFISRYGWAGVCVEPVPEVFERLTTNYGGLPEVQLVQAAISATPLPFWYVESTDFVTSQVGSLRRDRVETSMRLLGEAPDFPIEPHYPAGMPPAQSTDRRTPGRVVSFNPECLTFDQLMDRTGFERVDLVNIDVEGNDWDVLSMIDLDRYQVSVVIVETFGTGDSDAIVAHLTEHGYTFARTFGVFSSVWERPTSSSPAG